MSLARTMKEPGLVWVWVCVCVADFLEVTSSLLLLSFALNPLNFAQAQPLRFYSAPLPPGSSWATAGSEPGLCGRSGSGVDDTGLGL